MNNHYQPFIQILLFVTLACALSLSWCGKAYSEDLSLKCMADNIYWEARNQPVNGMIAVAFATLNRVNDERFPNSVCEVIRQGPTRPSWITGEPIPVKNRCQFSWYCDGKSDTIPLKDMNIYEVSISIAKRVMGEEFKDNTGGAVYYHADYVTPSWAKSKVRTIKIGNHIFYKWVNGKH